MLFSRRATRTLTRVPVLALFVSVAVWAQWQPPAAVQAINVVRSQDGLEIVITCLGSVTTETMRLSAPERFVLDIQNAVFSGAARKIDVDAEGIRSVRVGQRSGQGDPVTRVVVDLADARDFELTGTGETLRLKLRPADAAQATATEEKAMYPTRASSRARKQPAPPAAASSGVRIGRRKEQVPSPEPARVPVLVTSVDVVRNAGRMEIVIKGSGPMSARTMRLSGPERFVVDVDNSLLAGNSRTIKVDDGDIKSVRVGRLEQPHDSATRVVVDLARTLDVVVVREPNQLILRLPADEANHATIAGTPAVAAADRAPETATAAPALNTNDPKLDKPEATGNNAVAEVSAPPSFESPIAPPSVQPAPQVTPEPEIATDQNASEAKPAQPASGLGVGITGRGEDTLLGSDAEQRPPERDDRALTIAPVLSNEQPLPLVLRLGGSTTAGYYRADTKNSESIRQSSPVASVRFDASGYFHSPGFLSFSVKPQGSVGRQSSEGVFPDGEGVSATSTFLGGGVAPFTVSYNRVNRKVVTFGPLDRLAGLEADTFQDSLGANWRLRLNHLPEIGLNYAKYSDSYEPLTDLAAETTNLSRVYSADVGDRILGWNLQSHYRVERAAQDLINIFDPAQAPFTYRRDQNETRFSADRDFGRFVSLNFLGGATKSQNVVQENPFDQSFRFLTGNSFLRVTKKLTFAFRAGVTDNIVGATLQSSLEPNPASLEPPVVLMPTRAKLQMMSYSGSAQYAFTNDLRVHADAARETTRAPQAGSSISTPDSSLTSAEAGIAFGHRFRSWQFQSDYAANGGRFVYAGTGQSRSYGQRGSLGVTVGSLQSLEVSAGAQGSLQRVAGNTYMRDRSWAATLSLSRSLFEQWRLRATYNRAYDAYDFAATQFTSRGNAAMLAIVHPRVEISASYNLRDGLTFLADPRLQFVGSSESGVLLGAYPGMPVLPTGATWSSAALTLRPAGKLTGRAAALRSRQTLQGSISNNYTEWEASAGYQFRSLTLDAGYVLHNQNFGVDLFERNRFFFRVVREFTIFPGSE